MLDLGGLLAGLCLRQCESWGRFGSCADGHQRLPYIPLLPCWPCHHSCGSSLVGTVTRSVLGFLLGRHLSCRCVGSGGLSTQLVNEWYVLLAHMSFPLASPLCKKMHGLLLSRGAGATRLPIGLKGSAGQQLLDHINVALCGQGAAVLRADTDRAMEECVGAAHSH